jgi:tRNA A37 threonylcarbamoyladenosine synthetase subunit TsaC/SUA5/YrdC
MLGDSVRVFLDGGPTPGAVPSTIVDCTGQTPRVLRQGILARERLDEVLRESGVEIVDEG